MSTVTSTAASAIGLSWDGEGRRVSGGPLAPDLPTAPGEELTFRDVLAVLNPLQHIPVVSSIYRWVTGDTISPAARVAGGALYGGPIGLVTATFNAIVEQVKGADIGAQALALVTPSQPQETKPQMAAAATVEDNAAPAPEADRAAANLAALQQLAADLRSAAAETTEAKPAEPPPVAPLQPGQARTLAYYQANAGKRLSPTDTNRYALPQRQGSTALSHTTSSTPVPAAETGDKASPADQSESPPAAWFASAMMRGLDRYRTMQQADKAAPQVDVSY